MVTRRRSATAAVLGGALLVGTACSPDSSGTPLDRATGAVLADAADRLADALAADDPCRALLEADALRERALRALEEGEAPESVVVETTRVVDATTAGLTCDADDEAGEDAEDAANDDEDDPADDGDDTDGTEEREARPPASDPADEDDAGGGSGAGGSGGGAEPGKGPDGDGPPGQDRGRGSGTPPGHADGQGPG